MAVVYQHRRLDNNKVFYIGMGDNVSRAYKKDTSRVSTHWHNVVNKTDYIVEILKTGLSWDDAIDLEIWLIAEFGISRNSQLVNKTLGGGGALGYKHTDEFKNSVGERYRGKYLDNTTIEKLKNTNYVLSVSKQISQYSLNGEFIKDFKSIREAVRETGVDRSTLIKHLKGEFNTAKGYKWNYKK